MEWISVKDRLPDNDEPILIYGKATCHTCDPSPKVREGRMYNKRFIFGEYDCTCDVTHWMPLPETPKEKI